MVPVRHVRAVGGHYRPEIEPEPKNTGKLVPGTGLYPAARHTLLRLSPAIVWSFTGQGNTLRDREEARGLGRQRVEVGTPDGGELPDQRRPGDLDGDQTAEYEVVADGQPTEHARPDALRDR